MAVGTSSWMGLGLGRYGEYELTQITLGNDIVTITGATSQTGDFLVCRIAAGTEVFSVDVSGNVIATSVDVSGCVQGTVYGAAPSTTTCPAGGMAPGPNTAYGAGTFYFNSGGTIYYLAGTVPA